MVKEDRTAVLVLVLIVLLICGGIVAGLFLVPETAVLLSGASVVLLFIATFIFLEGEPLGFIFAGMMFVLPFLLPMWIVIAARSLFN